ncbi:MAG: hypothetical protein ABUS57_07180 [Pseudomonadota bacterium]
MVKHNEAVALENPLKRFLEAPGGISQEAAVQRATDSLEMIRHSAMEEIDSCLADIRTFSAMPSPTSAQKHQLHERSNSLLGFAGMYDMPDLCAAAYSLCELVDAMIMHGRWQAEAVHIHYDAMHKLREPQHLVAEERERLVTGLRQVTERIGGLTPRFKS